MPRLISYKWRHKSLGKCFSWVPRVANRHQEFLSALRWNFSRAPTLKWSKRTHKVMELGEKTDDNDPLSPKNHAKRRQSRPELTQLMLNADKRLSLSIFVSLSRNLVHSLSFFHSELRLYIASLSLHPNHLSYQSILTWWWFKLISFNEHWENHHHHWGKKKERKENYRRGWLNWEAGWLAGHTKFAFLTDDNKFERDIEQI